MTDDQLKDTCARFRKLVTGKIKIATGKTFYDFHEFFDQNITKGVFAIQFTKHRRYKLPWSLSESVIHTSTSTSDISTNPPSKFDVRIRQESYITWFLKGRNGADAQFFPKLTVSDNFSPILVKKDCLFVLLKKEGENKINSTNWQCY